MSANPVDRGKAGSKLHLVCDGGGLPLIVVVTANLADTSMFAALLDDVPSIRTPSGGGAPGQQRPRRTRATTRGQPRLAAAAWDQAADRSA